MKSIDILISKIKDLKNPTVAGLDPKPEYVPGHIMERNIDLSGRTPKAVCDAMWEFNKKLLDALSGVVPAIKPQSAFYEPYGVLGHELLAKTVEYAKKLGYYVILDVKRNDIGSTAAAYSAAYLGAVDIDGERYTPCLADSATVNPYLGTDGVMPFVTDCGTYNKTIFALVKTSNPSSGEIQDLVSDGKHIYEHVAELVNKWNDGTIGENGYGAVGAVVGATYPEQAAALRKIMRHSYFLVPGYGAQGGGAKSVKPCFNPDGLGAVVNSSRGIMCAYKKGDWKPEEFDKAARAEVVRMRDDIMGALNED